MTTKEIYKSVILEIRPRLQSVNILVNLVKKIEKVDIVLNDDNFEIVCDSLTRTIFCKNLKIVTDSLSSLMVADSYVSFRFATANSLDDWGSFKTELLKASESASKPNFRKIFTKKLTPYKVECRNCAQDLSEFVQFERILPLPSENSEPSDWFCHAHSSTKVSIMNPTESDFFYASCYCHLNKKLVKNFLQSENLLICKRCLSWLGQVKNSDVAKFWFNTVSFQEENNFHTTSALQDVFTTLQEILNSVLFNTAKIVLCCQSSKKQTDYILLWVLEKQLRVQICDFGENPKDCEVAKVLFKYEKNCSEIVKKWTEDSAVVSVDISKPMTLEILKHLYKFNKIFPKVFSESNNFYISYLMMYEPNK